MNSKIEPLQTSNKISENTSRYQNFHLRHINSQKKIENPNKIEYNKKNPVKIKA